MSARQAARSRRSRFALPALVLLAGFSLLAWAALSNAAEIYRYVRSGEVGWAIHREIRTKAVRTVAIEPLTRFRWDRLHVFGPYTPAQEVCRRLSIPAADCSAAVPKASVDDGQMLLVFLSRGKVVHTEIHLRWHGDFAVADGEPLTPQTARFDVVADGTLAGGEPRLRLCLQGRPATNC